MASHFLNIPTLPLFFFFLFISLSSSDSISPQLSSIEQESVYQILESINPTFNWRLTYPNDLCYSSPHGINCDYFVDDHNNTSLHITELNFGYVSDYSPNPDCSPSASFSPSLTSLPYLRKLFFYKCFTSTFISLPPYFSNLTSLEQLIFIENPYLHGSLNEIVNLRSLKRLVFLKTNLCSEIPLAIGELTQIEEIKLTRNNLSGEVPDIFGKLKKLKILDLSFNSFKGRIPDFGELSEVFHLDLSFNFFNGRIPESLVKLQRLEFLDLSYNDFGEFGIPLFLAEMKSLKEVYLSGNSLGGPIPDIWKKLKGIVGIGLSEMKLVGEIPPSMGVFLRNVNYIRLDNNRLEGIVPEEFGLLEEVLHELNLENNLLKGRLPFSAKFESRIGSKLKISGNPELCVNGGGSKEWNSTKVCKKAADPNPVVLSGCWKRSEGFGLSFVFLLGLILI